MFQTCRLDRRSVRVSVSQSVGRLVCQSVQKVHCSKVAEWIQMSLGMVSGVGRGMGILDGGGDRRRGRGSFGREFRVPILTDGDFVAQLCGSA